MPIRKGVARSRRKSRQAAKAQAGRVRHRAARPAIQTHQLQSQRRGEDLRADDFRTSADRREVPRRRRRRGGPHPGNKERDLNKIESEAYRKSQTIRGTADAKATEIYARAYNQTPEAAELYEFVKSMETFKNGDRPRRHPGALDRQRPVPVPQERRRPPPGRLARVRCPSLIRDPNHQPTSAANR